MDEKIGLYAKYEGIEMANDPMWVATFRAATSSEVTFIKHTSHKNSEFFKAFPPEKLGRTVVIMLKEDRW